MNYRVILYTLGKVLDFEAVCMILPLLCGLIYKEDATKYFLLCIAICLVVAQLLRIFKPKNKTIYAKEGFVIVALSWIVISLFGSLPFLLSGEIPNFFDALFETVSGFTTTGASILDGSKIDALSKCMLFWRSFTHWVGGMGVLVFLVAVLPLSGGNNLHLMKAESPGPEVGKFVPKVRTTATWLYGMYLFLTVLEMILLKIAGMSIFESITLSFGTAGTGGFAVLGSGFATYSYTQQMIIGIFMMLFGIDFSFYFLLLSRRFRDAFEKDEVKAYFLIILVASAVIFYNCMKNNIDTNLGNLAKDSFFQVSSIITTTGFSTADFNAWPQLSKGILVLLMFFGACAGSTGGGMKISRIMILTKSIFKEIKLAAHPNRTYKIKMNKKTVPHEVVRGVNTYTAAYFAIMAVAFLLISCNGYDFETTFTSVVSTMNNIGPGLGMVGPNGNFGEFKWYSKVVFSILMVAGRLEIFPMLVLMSKHTWKK